MDELCTSIQKGGGGTGGGVGGGGGDRGSLKQNGTGSLRTGHLAGLMQHISISRMLQISNGVQLGPSQLFFFFEICHDLGVTSGPAF